MGKKKGLMKINNDFGKPKKLKDRNSLKKKIRDLLTQNAQGALQYTEDGDGFENIEPFVDDYVEIKTAEKPAKKDETGVKNKQKKDLKRIITPSLVTEVDSPFIKNQLKVKKAKKGKAIKFKKYEKEESDFVNAIQSIVSSEPSTSKQEPVISRKKNITEDIGFNDYFKTKEVLEKPVKKVKEKKFRHKSIINEWEVSSVEKSSENKRKTQRGSDETNLNEGKFAYSETAQVAEKNKMKRDVVLAENFVGLKKNKKTKKKKLNPCDEFDPNNSLAAKIIEKISCNDDDDEVMNNVKSSPPAVVVEEASNMEAPPCILNFNYYSFKQKHQSVGKYTKSILDLFKQSDDDGSQDAIISTVETDLHEESQSSESNQGVENDLNESNALSENVESEVSHSDESSQEYDHDEITTLNEALQTSDSDVSLRDESLNIEVTENQARNNSYELIVLSNTCLVFLKPHTTLYFSGKCQASLLSGSVGILGHALTSDPCDVYSLTTSIILGFETSRNTENIIDKELHNLINSMPIPREKKEEMITKVGESEGVLLLKPLENNFTQFIEKHLEDDVFSKRKMGDGNHVNNDALEVLNCSFTLKKSPGIFSSQASWNKAVKHILKKRPGVNNTVRHSNVTMICGGKDAGKSTFLRYLINKLHRHTAVLVIDLDPGQPEFTVCGLLSATLVAEPLLGPNFTHLKESERSQCLGFIDITENEDRYLSAVEDLIEYCNSETKYENLPWIINTAGFTQGSGLKNIISIINICRPSLVVEVKCSNTKINFSFDLTPQNIMASEYRPANTFKPYSHLLVRPFKKSWDTDGASLCSHTKPKTKRIMNFLGYFSRIAAPPTFSILDMVPFVVPLNLIGLAFNTVPVDDEYIACILNGRAVALCSNNSQNESKVFTLGDKSLQCYGYGVVRGIDANKKLLYLLTPLPLSVLTKVNVLMYSDCLPDSSTLSMGNLLPNIRLPYTCQIIDGEQDKAFSNIPRRKFNPFRLLEMKNKANASA